MKRVFPRSKLVVERKAGGFKNASGFVVVILIEGNADAHIYDKGPFGGDWGIA